MTTRSASSPTASAARRRRGPAALVAIAATLALVAPTVANAQNDSAPADEPAAASDAPAPGDAAPRAADRERVRDAVLERLIERRMQAMRDDYERLRRLRDRLDAGDELDPRERRELRRLLRPADTDQPLFDRPRDRDSNRRPLRPGAAADAQPDAQQPDAPSDPELVLGFLRQNHPTMFQRIDDARRNDPDAFDTLMRQHGPRLLRMAREFRNDPERFTLRKAMADAELRSRELLREAARRLRDHASDANDQADADADPGADPDPDPAASRDTVYRDLRAALREPVRRQLEVRLRLAMHDLERAQAELERRAQELESTVARAEALVDERIEDFIATLRLMEAGDHTDAASNGIPDSRMRPRNKSPR